MSKTGTPERRERGTSSRKFLGVACLDFSRCGYPMVVVAREGRQGGGGWGGGGSLSKLFFMYV